MKKRAPNPRLVKIHRNYTVGEAATVCGVHKNTIRAWLRTGLPTIDNTRPILILGSDLREYLERKRSKNKRPLKPGEIYCVKCRDSRRPAEDYAVIDVTNDRIGNLSGICPVCDKVMNRKVSFRRLADVIGDLQISIPEALERLIQREDPFVNGDFR